MRGGTYAHEEDDVATVEKGVKDLVAGPLLESLLDENQARRSEHHKETMSNVTKHDSEKERERDDRKQSRVDLLVRSNTVRIDDGLHSLGHLVRTMERGGVLVRTKLVQDRRDGRAGGFLRSSAACSCSLGSTHRGLSEGALDTGDVTRRDPSFSEESLATLVPLPQVERGVHHLLASDDTPPRRDRLGNLGELKATRLVRRVEHRVEVLDARGHVAELVLSLVRVRVDREERRAHG